MVPASSCSPYVPIIILILIFYLLTFTLKGWWGRCSEYNISVVCSKKTSLSRDVKGPGEPRGSREKHKGSETVLSMHASKWF